MYLFDDKRENRELFYIMFSFHILIRQTCNTIAYKHAISFNYIALFFSFYLKFTKNIFSNCMVIYSVIYTRNICSQSIQVIIIRHLNSPLLNPCKQTGNLLWYYTTHLHTYIRDYVIVYIYNCFHDDCGWITYVKTRLGDKNKLF